MRSGASFRSAPNISIGRRSDPLADDRGSKPVCPSRPCIDSRFDGPRVDVTLQLIDHDDSGARSSPFGTAVERRLAVQVASRSLPVRDRRRLASRPGALARRGRLVPIPT